MESEPLVSVLMPAYNSASFISAAIESILAQTYTNFELLIIDDGSTDSTLEIISKYASCDPRIRLFIREHYGLVNTLNFGLDQADGLYLARLDADDISVVHRLEIQKNYLEAQPEVVIIGSAYTLIDQMEVPIRISHMPQSDVAIHWHCLFHSPFAHSSVFLRLEVLRRNGLSYDPAMKEAEDYELWSRLLKYGQGYNFPEPLVEYRVHPAQASQHSQSLVWENASRVAQKNLIDLGAPLPLEQVQRLREWYYRFPIRFEEGDLPLAEALLEILNRFSLQQELDFGEVECIRGRWLGRLLRAAFRSKNKGLSLRLLRRLTPKDLRVVMAFLRSREKLDF